MKTIFMSGISARVKRWGYRINLFMVAGLLVVITAPSASAAPIINPMVQCVPFLDKFEQPLRPLIKFIGGGLAGLIIPVAAILIVIGIITSAWKAFRGEQLSGLMFSLIGIVAVVFGGAAALILLSAVVDVIYDSCSQKLIG